tara:strand:+ start:8410 stop:8715 length:306 start_codon:yes stop_codon:yes gene_type:complete
MNNKQAFYFLPVALFAVLGLFTSLVHYHSDGLECLDHAEEAHIVQNESFCPICTLIVQADIPKPLSFDAFLSFFEILNSPSIIPLPDSTFFLFSERAPPLV